MQLFKVFQICKSEKSDSYHIADGRLLNDLYQKDRLVLVKGKDIDNSDDTVYLSAEDAETHPVRILDIVSYGRSWEFLNAGMSARIRCQCDAEIDMNDVICKIIGQKGAYHHESDIKPD